MATPLLIYSGPAEQVPLITRLLGSLFSIQRAEADHTLLANLEHATVFLDASMKIRIPRETIEKAKALQLVITATTGADHIDAQALAERHIPLLTLKDQTEFLHNITPAAEHSWLLLMACARKLRAASAHAERGEWDRTQFPGILLKGKTLGIIGMGRLGSWMARYAEAFGMTVLAHDPFISHFPPSVAPTALLELLAHSHFVSVHVHLSPETRQLLNKENLAHLKKGAVLINTSRGEVLDDAAVVDALTSGTLSAVGVDVLSGEPAVTENPLWKYAQTHDTVIMTPHIAGFSPEALEHVLAFTCERIIKHFLLYAD